MTDTRPDDDIDDASRAVGARLRSVRHQRGLSLDEVERTSGGRWSASAVGAYERGFRNLSLPRLRDLADYYSVPIQVLLEEPSSPSRAARPGAPSVSLDLVALDASDAEELGSTAAFARLVVERRGDWNGRVLTMRADDVRALAWGMGLDEAAYLTVLEGHGVVITDVRGFLEAAGGPPAGG
ncbi:MAG TPA: helix-turn-helix domain-containing protein [Acidimicrobiales bacterium]|nr:helix-turn-helix domain-containing protein [Acidimicrobiales bacterium]